jgi:putative ABC transport system permease protein
LLTESLLLAAVGGVLGVVTGYAMLYALLAVMPPLMLPSQADLRLNPAVLLFTLGATTVAGLLVGCAPAWLASRVDPVEALKEGGRSSGGVGHQRLRQGLVVGEFALAIALLAGAGLAIHSFLNLERTNLGVRTDHVFTIALPVPDTRPMNPEQMVAYYHRMLAKVETVPGVSSAAVSKGLPLQGAGFGTSFSIAGQPAYSDPSKRPFTFLALVTADYYKTYGIRLIKGRAFTDQDTRSTVPVAVVNQYLVDHYLKGIDPLGQRVLVDEFVPGLQKGAGAVERQVVGVVNTVPYHDGFRDVYAEVDVPFWQSPWPKATIGVRTSVEPQSVSRSLAAAVHAVDPDVAVATPRTMDEVRTLMMSSDRFTFILFVCFAAIALLLASIGIYGVTAFSVSQRLHEMAIRSALGASRRRVIGLVVTEGLTLAVTGLGVGLVGAYIVGRFMHALLFGVGVIDIPAFGLVGILLLVAALVACFVPAYRAASAEPLAALRAQ